MRINSGARTDVGRIRTNNEDSFRVASSLNLFVLSDGMGGEAHGEVASAMAVETVVRHCLESVNNFSAPSFVEPRPDLSAKTNRLVSAVHLANRKIREAALGNVPEVGMGATILAAWLDGQRLSLVHVGDSRAYLLRAGSLEQLTSDHSLVAEQVRRGLLTPQQAETSTLQSVLLRALGTEDHVDVDVGEHVLLDGDAVVLCSDGLSHMVTDPEIASTLVTHLDAQAAADRLVELANEYGGEDNVTVIVLRVSLEPGRLWDKLRRWVGHSSTETHSAGDD